MQKLKIKNGKVINENNQVVFLRGVNIGGWMNFENFIDGFPGSEMHFRALLKQSLGENKANFFLDRFLDHLFNEDDVKFIRNQGMNVIRLPINYRHFESDQSPYHYLEAGFERLEQVLGWCERHEIYVILDLHAVQGWQNGDWHCDNSSRHSLFWTHKQFQDRFYALWQEFAERYRNRNVVAAYNIINEPLSNAQFGRFVPDNEYVPDYQNLNRIYREAVESIREKDTEKIIILEGDYYSVLFSGLEAPFDRNLMYSSHNYIEVCTSALPSYPGDFNNNYWDNERIKQQFVQTEGYQFAKQYNVPLLVGEFGFNAQHISEKPQAQLDAFIDQIKVYNENLIHWTIWTYKDVGLMGWLQFDPESDYMQTIRPVLAAKDALRTDFGWLAGYPQDVQDLINQLSDKVLQFIPGLDPATNRRYFSQAAMSTYTADQLQMLYAQQFSDKTEKQIDQILRSMRLEYCLQNKKLNLAISDCL
jgi:aryl-phospho-beta-D-glucosidase BglC (GH1 family)